VRSLPPRWGDLRGGADAFRGRNLIRGLILIACVGLQSTEDAAAADIPYPVKAPGVVDVPPSWAGFYLGGQVGYGMDSVGWRNLGSSALFSPLKFAHA
jgi:hypothetical protein